MIVNNKREIIEKVNNKLRKNVLPNDNTKLVLSTTVDKNSGHLLGYQLLMNPPNYEYTIRSIRKCVNDQ
jgi:hypothetical protein